MKEIAVIRPNELSGMSKRRLERIAGSKSPMSAQAQTRLGALSAGPKQKKDQTQA